ncbi:hypothetical protein Fmac_002057 [Flemingia macrophylla]|uniref:Uncharacterized protein n=1 Tax=Flemingia macrophylla TaxID=520843 RepID=A0ABD1NIV5_9FABA
MMDVFIPEDYVRRRRVEKKKATAKVKPTQTLSHSQWNSNDRSKHDKFSQPDQDVFICLSA